MGEMTLFIPLIIGLGLIMFLSSRRQRKAMQATIDLQESLAVGDRVHTTSGLEATITGIADDSVDLEIAPGIITTWMKLAVRDRIVEDDELDDEQDAGEYEQDGPADAHDVDPTTNSTPSATNPLTTNPSTSGPSATGATSSPKTDN